MNEQQAIALVQKTFKSAFDRSGYIHFLKNLLNEFDDEGARSNQGARIPDKFQNHVEKLERVGKYKAADGEAMLFIVYLKNDTSIERARTMQRNFIAHYLQMDMKDAALVAFVSKNPANWRFSFIKMEYRYDEEKNKIKEEFTPAKRWSFLVGTNEASHTAQRKLVPLMADDEHNPTLADLEDAFNIEKVTKEFFEKYRGLFIRTKEALDEAVSASPKLRSEFESKGIDTVNFAKKLLGQIVFLYYLQKKGWFGVARDAAWGEGSRNFLRELFDKKHGDYENFFNDILEPLFYDALRRDRSEDDHFYPAFKCKIPFLNGGLFDPMNNYDWVKTDILLPNDLFHNTTRTKEGDEGDGILDIFDRYNFTVKEDEPFEKEVAIDPELLGKAYEKFNAIRPDNYAEFLKALKSGKKGDESKFNKQYGVYYTPREIVHYMCQQSLINYLYSELNPNAGFDTSREERAGLLDHQAPTKEDIATLILKGEQIKEHDERVAAEGRETATYSFQMPESIRTHAALIDEKLANIKVCDPAVGSGAFPVGMMNEIVRAREVLKIYPPQSPHFQGKWGEAREAGRGAGVYDFKRACIENSLYGVDIDPGAVEIAKLRLWLSLVVDEDDIQNIKPLPNLDYKIVCGNSLIGFPDKGWGDSWGSEIEKEIESLIHKYFNETNVTKKNELKAHIDEKIENRYKNSLKTFGYKVNFDFKTVFSEVFQRNSGFDVVIANPPYIDSERMVGEGQLDLRKTIAKTYKLTKGNWDIYIAFFEKGFNLLNSKGTLTFITPDKWISKPFGDALRISKISNLLAILKAGRDVFEDAKVDAIVSLFSNTAQEYVNVYMYDTEIFLKDKIQKKELKSPYTLDALFSRGLELIQKIDSAENKLSDNFLCENACATSDAYKLKPFVHENKGNTFNSETHFKISNTGTIGKYFSKWGIQPMVYLGDDYLRPVIKREEFFHNFKNSYSKKTLRPKIIMKGLNLLDAFLDEHGITIPGKTTLVITHEDNNQEDLRFLLALINSSLIFYYIKEKYSASSYNLGVSFTTDMINGVPFPKSNSNLRKKVLSNVERILAAKAKNPQADTSALEEEIDQLVYQLYGLTEEEIRIVEGK